MITAVSCKIEPRFDGKHPFTEILHTWRENGVPRYALSRVNYLIADSMHARAYQIQQFIKRRSR